MLIFGFILFSLLVRVVTNSIPRESKSIAFAFAFTLQPSLKLRRLDFILTTATMNGRIEHDNETSDFEFDLSRFTNEEKLSWLGGYNLWNLRAIPGLTTTNSTSSGRISNRSGRSSSRTSSANATSICLSDGPHGLRKPINDFTLQEAHPATCFPSACSSACSWNPGLLQTMGRALAKECNFYGVQVLLGPGVNLKRHPCGGRNHEYFSEDPYLAGMLAKSYINGVQESGTVGACIKHFCLNNQESKRFVVDVVVDERTMRELYLPAFEHALCSDNKSSVPKLVMGAYNKVNGVYCCENEYLLGSILRGEWKYDGVVVSDWGAILDRKASLRAGMDLEMPGTPTMGAFDLEVLEEVESERSAITQRENDEEQPMVASSNRSNSNSELENSIDACANRVVKLIADLHTSEPENTGLNEVLGRELFNGHDRLAREIATECIVLLQNKENFLPLSRDMIFERQSPKIGIIGGFAKDSPRYQGMGSAHVTPTKVTTFYDTMSTELSSAGGASPNSIPFAKGYHPDDDSDEVHQALIDEAVSVAQQPEMDVLVVCIGLPEIAESEGFDRTHCRLPKQHIALVEALAEIHFNIVVVLNNGGIVEIPQSFVEGTKAILDGFLLGQAGGAALVDVLLGDVSPSGKLPETIPIVPDSDVPSGNYFPGTNERVEYREGLDVGYRYYDTVGIPVRFPFGHGLQYTTFEYSNLSVTIEQDEARSKRVRVILDVTNNTGNPSFSKSAKEVVQLYIKPISSSVYRPHHELKGFSKIEVAPGSTETVEFVLDERAFSYYDIGWRDWVVEEASGGFEVRVGTSSRDIRLTEIMNFSTGRKPSELATKSYPPSIQNANLYLAEQDNQRLVVDDEIFAKRFGNTTSSEVNSNSKNTLTYQPPGDVSNSLKKNKDVLTTHSSTATITRNTLIVDAAKISRLGSVLMFVSYMVAKQEVKEGPTKTRELRMIRANLENVPLRSLVVFSQGNLTFKTLDVLIHVMNGEYRKALRRLFRRRK